MYIGNIEALKKILSNICAMLSSAHSNEDVFKDALERELQDMYKFTDDSFSLNPIHLYDKYHLAIRPREGAWVVNAEGHRVKDPVDVALIAVKALNQNIKQLSKTSSAMEEVLSDFLSSLKSREPGVLSVEIPEDCSDPSEFIKEVLRNRFGKDSQGFSGRGQNTCGDCGGRPNQSHSVFENLLNSIRRSQIVNDVNQIAEEYMTPQKPLSPEETPCEPGLIYHELSMIAEEHANSRLRPFNVKVNGHSFVLQYHVRARVWMVIESDPKSLTMETFATVKEHRLKNV